VFVVETRKTRLKAGVEGVTWKYWNDKKASKDPEWIDLSRNDHLL
jgi:hypothetical protein